MKINESQVSGQSDGPEGGSGSKKLGAVCGLLFVAILVVALFSLKRLKELDAELALQVSEIEKFEETIKELAGEAPDAPAEEPEGGPSRSTLDEEASSLFLRKLLTWRSYPEYQEVRAWLSSSCQAADTDGILTNFLPEVAESTFGETNLEFDEAEYYEVGRDGDTISYFALCSVTNKINKNTGHGLVSVFYTLDGNQNVSSVSAYTIVD